MLAFGSGWRVNGWRMQANHVKTMERLVEVQQQKLKDQAEAFKLGGETLRLRETQLAQQLADERQEVEDLRDEIANTPVVERVVHVPVEGKCPACATVDVLRFRTLYNRAATGAVPSPSTGDDDL